MKTVKFFFLAAAMTLATNVNAQFAPTSKSSSGFQSTEIDTKSHFVADFRVGGVASVGGFGINLGGTKEIASFMGCTLAWDFINVEFAAPFNSPADMDMLSAKTGLRLFSPSFAKDNIRLYTNLAMGYTCVLTKGVFVGSSDMEKLWYYWSNGDKMQANHGFGLTWGAGVQIKKKFSIGYTLQYETAFKSKNHFATFGFTF